MRGEITSFEVQDSVYAGKLGQSDEGKRGTLFEPLVELKGEPREIGRNLRPTLQRFTPRMLELCPLISFHFREDLAK